MRATPGHGLLVLFFALPACAWAGATAEDYSEYLDDLYRDTVPVVIPDEVESYLDQTPGTLLLDVRSNPEREVSFIEGSEFYDFDTFQIDRFLSLPRDTPVLAYCAVGYRSERVGEMFIEAGFTNVRHVYGGIIEWQNSGLTLEHGEVEVRAEPADGVAFDGPPVHGHSPRWGKYVMDGNVVYEPPAE